ncbi:MAG TPA: lysophospholipid acyltransferase family protein [Thermomicrobiales bacterium]|nr:lysophospholipid acyltransferase family protein [Thermomicrobiales bacterium]
MIDPLFNRKLTFRRRWKHGIFLLLRIFVVPTLRVVLRFRIHGLQNVPKRGGALIIANHVHNSDPILILSASPRPILWMAKEEVWSLPVLRWFATQAGAFPVKRGTFDRDAIRTAVDTINEGLLVGMFPEGTRSTTGGLKEPYAGASLVALRSGAPIIPCVIVGSEDLPFDSKAGRAQRKRRMYPKVEVWFGEPFMLRARADDGRRYSMAELTDAMMIELAQLLPEPMRGVYGGDRSATPHPAISREGIRFPGGD